MKKKQIKVLFVTSGYPSPEGPNHGIFIHRSIMTLLPHINVQVIQLRAWLPGRPIIKRRKWEEVDVVTVFCLQSPVLSHFHFNTRILEKVGRFILHPFIKKADLIHATDLYPNGFIASQWASIYKKKHTVHVIGSDLNLFLAPNLEYIGTNWLYRICGFACNSKAILNKLNLLAPGLQNLHIVYRGVDSFVFNPDGFIKGPQADLPPVRFLFLGGFHTWNPKSPLYSIKGGHILLKAWQQIESIISPCSLFLGGPRVDSSKLEPWRQALSRPQAVFFSSVIPPSDVPSLIRSCDVVVIPSFSEGLPNLANEAQACGRPVLATDSGGTPESVIHGETGWIVQRGDLEALAEGLIWFVEHKVEIPNMGQRARKHVMENFRWKNFGEKMLNLFDDVLEQDN